jgi:integrase
MAKQVNLLTALDVERKRDPGLYFDGEGLYLQVTGAGARSWIYRYTLKGKARWQGLGSAQQVSLKDARIARDGAQSMVRKGIDPVGEKRAAREAQKTDKPKVLTFREAVAKYLDKHDDTWSSPKHRQQWQNTLQTYAFPEIGDTPVNQITATHVVAILEPIWKLKSETARRVRGRIEIVLDYVADPDDHAFRNPAALTERLKKALPKLKKRKPEHHAALPYPEIGHFMFELRERDAIAARALEFVILTAARTTEVLQAAWTEVDFEAAVWTIPADRMKAGKEHRVPLSPAAMAVLSGMARIRQNDLIFPGTKPGQPLSNMTMLKVLERLGYPDLTVHGFRSTFRDWAAERTNYPNEVVEMALAHAIGNKVEKAYRRGDLFEKRRRLMDDWAAFCSMNSATEKGGVIPFRAAHQLPG